MVLYNGTFNGFLGFAGGEKTKKRCGGEAGRRDVGGELEPGRGMTAAGRRGGRRAAGGGGGEGVRYNDNQSMLLHRFRGGERRRGWLFLHRWKIAPAAAVYHGRRR